MNSTIFFNGKFVSENDVHISVRTHALHYGTGCFEGIRAYYNKKENVLYAFRMDAHFKRFINSCKTLFIDLPYTAQQLCEITAQLIQKNFEKTDIYIRPLAFKSDPAVGNFNLKSLKDSLAIYTTPLGRYLNGEAGIRANVSSWTRIQDNSIPPKAKITGSYVNTSLAKTESLLHGFDEALLLDSNGHVVEGSAENIFIVQNNTVITPPTSDDILVGVTRDTVIQLLTSDIKQNVVEKSIDRSQLYSADEVFLVGTGAEITPVVEIDNRKVGLGKIGEITKQIKDLYADIVHGNNAHYKEFVTRISEKH